MFFSILFSLQVIISIFPSSLINLKQPSPVSSETEWDTISWESFASHASVAVLQTCHVMGKQFRSLKCVKQF